MARAIHSMSPLVAPLLLLALALVATAQRGPGDAPDELRFNGNEGDNASPSPVSPPSSQPSGQRPSPVAPFRPSGQLPSDDLNSDDLQDPLRPFAPNFLEPFGNGLFGNSRQDQFRSPFSSLFDNLFGHIHRQANQMNGHLNRQLQDMERAAEEGQTVRYINRNGVAYVQTCTTKRLSDADQSQSKPINLLPFERSNSQKQQQQQQPEQQSLVLPEQKQSPQSPQGQQSLEQPLEQPAVKPETL